jgi:hypothetical protein
MQHKLFIVNYNYSACVGVVGGGDEGAGVEMVVEGPLRVFGPLSSTTSTAALSLAFWAL